MHPVGSSDTSVLYIGYMVPKG